MSTKLTLTIHRLLHRGTFATGTACDSVCISSQAGVTSATLAHAHHRANKTSISTTFTIWTHTKMPSGTKGTDEGHH